MACNGMIDLGGERWCRTQRILRLSGVGRVQGGIEYLQTLQTMRMRDDAISPTGGSELRVSEICLGSMTFGVQNTETEGHAQLDFAFDRGVNFIDTAEMYPVPPSADSYGRTEEIVGTWLRTAAA